MSYVIAFGMDELTIDQETYDNLRHIVFSGSSQWVELSDIDGNKYLINTNQIKFIGIELEPLYRRMGGSEE